VALQAMLVKAVLGYDKSLASAQGGLRVGIVRQGNAGRDLAAAFESAGIRAVLLGTAPTDAQVAGMHALVIVGSGLSGGVGPVAARNQLLTIGEAAAEVERGELSVGLVLNANGKPRILVHLTRMRSEGHVLSADLLSLATVFR
jgi:hypothetical protein